MSSRASTWTPGTPTYLLLADRLGQDPLEFIWQRRTATPPASYPKIAVELRERTKIYVTHEIPRRWLVAAMRRGRFAKPDTTQEAAA